MIFDRIFPLRKENVSVFLPIVLIASALGIGLMILTNMLEGKWLVSALFGLLLVWVGVMNGDLEYFCLLLFVFFLPIRVDVYLTYAPITAEAKGISISACDVALAGLYVAWVVRLLSVKMTERRLRFIPSFSLPFGIFFLWGALSSAWAVDANLSLFELVRLMKVWLAFFYLSNQVYEEKKITGLGICICLSILIQSLVSFAQYFQGTTFGVESIGMGYDSFLVQKTGMGNLARIGGTLGHPNKLAFFLISTLPVALSLWLSGRKRWLSIFSLTTLALGIGTLVLTFSRGGWVSFFLMLPLIFMFGSWKQRKLLRVSAAFVGFGFLVLSILLPFTYLIGKRVFEEDYGRGYSRIPMMQVARNVIRTHAVRGVGLNNYAMVMENYDDTPEKITLNSGYPVHNMYLLTAAEIGFPGLVILIWLLASVWKGGWLSFKKTQGITAFFSLGLLGGYTGCLIHRLVEPQYFTSSYSFALMAGLWGSSSFSGRGGRGEK